MSGTRFARSGKCRMFVYLGLVVFMFGVIAFWNTQQQQQQQLEETKEQRLRCEKQQDELSDHIAALEEKMKIEKNYEREIDGTRKSLDEKLTSLTDIYSKEQAKYETLKQTHKWLQTEHNKLVVDSSQQKQQQDEEIKESKEMLKTLQAQIDNLKNVENTEVQMWKDKFHTIMKEKDIIESKLNEMTSKDMQLKRIRNLEMIVGEYKTHCDYKVDENFEQKSDQLSEKDAAKQQLDKPIVKKQDEISFKKLELVSPGLYHIGVKINNKTLESNNKEIGTETISINNGGGLIKSNNLEDVITLTATLTPTTTLHLKKLIQPYSGSYNNRSSMIINSVENFQIVPKTIQNNQQIRRNESSAALKVEKLSTEDSKLKQELAPDNAAQKQTSTSSSRNLPPLPVPPNVMQPQRKLPENVAPIPANFDELLKNDASNQDGNKQNENATGGGDTKKSNKDEAINNRYSNIANEIDGKVPHNGGGGGGGGNDDSGAHEDFMNDDNLNAAIEDDKNFFDAAGGKNDGDHDHDMEDDDMIGGGVGGVGGIGGNDGGVGDIAVKNANHLLDNDDLNNEVVADQGKENADGLHLDDGNDEEEDEDDYSNLAARQKGAQAIRN